MGVVTEGKQRGSGLDLKQIETPRSKEQISPSASTMSLPHSPSLSSLSSLASLGCMYLLG